jgi:hypothetical protein
MPRSKIDRSLLEAALVGFGHKLGDVTLQIDEIKRMLGIRQAAAKPTKTQRRQKPLSAAARARIGAAQKARWAVQKKRKGQSATVKQPTQKKRKISPDARKRMSEATRKRWAEYRANKTKPS